MDDDAHVSALMRFNTKKQLAKSYAGMEKVLERRAHELAIAHNHLARMNQDWCKARELARILASPPQGGLIMLLWGRHDCCVNFARYHGLPNTMWRWVDTHAHSQFRGIEGPLRNSQSRFRLMILDSADWRPSAEDLDFAHALGFRV